MSAYLGPIRTAAILFPILAALAVLPYAIQQYRKYGSISKLKLALIFSFCFYLLCAYFLVILPLPDRSYVATLTTPRYNLIPLTAVRYFFKTTVLQLTQPSTYLVAMRQSAFLQPFFNLMLTVPFGLFLRYIWGVSFKKAVLASFCLSLFFELTQLSGLYFIYPRSYRLFDVDDLILNTSGGALGYLIEPLFVKIFPTIEQLNQDAASTRTAANFWRRTLAFLIDMMIVNLGLSLITSLLPKLAAHNLLVNLVGSLGYFILLPYLNHGATLGKKLVKIRIVSLNEQRVGFGALFLRQVSLFAVMLGNLNYLIPEILKQLAVSEGHQLAFYFTGLALAGAFLLLSLLNVLVLLLKKNSRMFYERLTRTKEIGY
ncbi:VanZ family protein [Lapidilactobacillus bayanensis]|uniref:VanZ family protein n=1 Tax=Lapidilactobacillus bayanensis TaxID=2485998 RepID=UPI000F7AC6A9|nr:VanZ family protein [Lapidilactobacillus bayanensis]